MRTLHWSFRIYGDGASVRSRYLGFIPEAHCKILPLKSLKDKATHFHVLIYHLFCFGIWAIPVFCLDLHFFMGDLQICTFLYEVDMVLRIYEVLGWPVYRGHPCHSISMSGSLYRPSSLLYNHSFMLMMPQQSIDGFGLDPFNFARKLAFASQWSLSRR